MHGSDASLTTTTTTYRASQDSTGAGVTTSTTQDTTIRRTDKTVTRPEASRVQPAKSAQVQLSACCTRVGPCLGSRPVQAVSGAMAIFGVLTQLPITELAGCAGAGQWIGMIGVVIFFASTMASVCNTEDADGAADAFAKALGWGIAGIPIGTGLLTAKGVMWLVDQCKEERSVGYENMRNEPAENL